jgi:hypothetical protein
MKKSNALSKITSNIRRIITTPSSPSLSVYMANSSKLLWKNELCQQWQEVDGM